MYVCAILFVFCFFLFLLNSFLIFYPVDGDVKTQLWNPIIDRASIRCPLDVAALREFAGAVTLLFVFPPLAATVVGAGSLCAPTQFLWLRQELRFILFGGL